MKNTRNLSPSQIYFLDRSLISAEFFNEDPQLVKNLPDELLKLGKSHTRVADYILKVALNYEYVFPSQYTIAEALDLSREHVNRIIRDLYRIGFLAKKQRWNNSNMYKVHPTVFLRPNIEKLHTKFTALRGLLAFLCLVAFTPSFGNNVTLRNNIKDIKKEDYIIAPSKKAKSMHDVRPSTRLTTVIQQLPFSMDTSQKIFLCGFTPEALEYAQDKLSLATGTLRSPWRFFLHNAFNYLKEEDIKYQWKLVNDILNQRGIKEVNLEAKFVARKTSESPKEPQKEESSSIFTPTRLNPNQSLKEQVAQITKDSILLKAQAEAHARSQRRSTPSHHSLAYEIQRCYANIEIFKALPTDILFFTQDIRDELIKKLERDIDGHKKDLERL